MTKKILVLVLGLALMGVGCSWFNGKEEGKRVSFQGMSPTEAAEKLQFLPGDTFEIQQRVYGFEALVPGFLKSDKGVRKVTITRFAPTNVANLEWETTLDVETEDSKKARDDYEASIANLSSDDVVPERPEPAFESRTVSGTVDNISLAKSHKVLLPAYWEEGDMNAVTELSGIWLADDPFQELTRTGQTVLSFNVFHEASAKAIRGANDLKDALDALRNASQTAKTEERKDVDYVEMLDESVPYELTIDGKKITVEAFRARNWYGEMVVLKNRQNPLILELTINPLAAGANEVFGDKVGSLEDLFGYKVDNFTLKTFN